MCVRPAPLRTLGALLGRLGLGAGRDAVGGDVGSEQAWCSCPGPLCSPGVTIGSEQTCGATRVPLLTWRRGSRSPALALSSLWFPVHLGLCPPCVWVPPEQSGQQQGQMSPEPPITLTFHPGSGRPHYPCSGLYVSDPS